MSDQDSPSPKAVWVFSAPRSGFHRRAAPGSCTRGHLTSTSENFFCFIFYPAFCPPHLSFSRLLLPSGCPLTNLQLICANMPLKHALFSLGIHTVLAVILCAPLTVFGFRSLEADISGRGCIHGPECFWVLVLSLVSLSTR